MISCFSVIISSCEKEEVNELHQDEINRTQTSFETDAIKAGIFTTKLRDRLSQIDDDTYLQNALPIKAQLAKAGRLIHSKSDSLVPLEDVFLYHQGAINALHATVADPEDETEEYIYYYHVPVMEVGLDSFAIRVNDLNVFLTNLINDLNVEVNTNDGEYLVVSRFELAAINATQATIKIGFIAAEPSPVVTSPFPEKSVWAYGELGECINTSWIPNGYDAAEIIDYHIKQHAALFSQCSAGQSRFLVYLDKFDSRAPFTHGVSPLTVKTYYPHSHGFFCIGDDQDPVNNQLIWDDYFDNAIYIPDRAKLIFSNPGNVVWLVPNYDSYSTFYGAAVSNGASNYHAIRTLFYRKICI